MMFPQPELQAPSQPQPTLAAYIPVAEEWMYKNDLHCYCQRLGIPLPVYQTAVEGCTQSIRYRSTVLVDTRRFTSVNTFPNRKSAEQDVAKLALQHVINESVARSKNLRLYLGNLVCREKSRCKMILHEFAAKIKAEYEYKTVQVEISSVFVSSVTLNSTCYNGEAGKNKKEAEQLAALSAILSLLDDVVYAPTISEVIKSKFKSCVAFYEAKNFQNTRTCSVTNDEYKITSLTNDPLMQLSQQTCSVEQIISRPLADKIIQSSKGLPDNNKEQGNSRKLTDKHCGQGMVDEKQQELVNLQAKVANHCNLVVLDDKQDSAGFPVEAVTVQAKVANLSNLEVLDDKQDRAGFPVEAVTISRSSYVPLPIILPALLESHHEYTSSEAAMVPSVPQQNSIPKCVTTQDVTNNLISAKNRPRNNSKKRRMKRKRAAKRVRAESQGNDEEQGGSRKLTDEHCGYIMVDKKQEEMVNLQAKTANGNNFGVLDAKQGSAGFPIEAVTISRSSYVPLPIISSTLSESQHKYKLSEAAMVPNVLQQNSITKCVTTQDVTDNLIFGKKRRRNNSKKRRMNRKRAAMRVRAESQVS